MQLDHLTVIAPNLATGAEHVRATLGIDMPMGGRHLEMGTHNLLVRLGRDLFLEVIAVDPEALTPEGPRWFGLDDGTAVRSAWEAGHRLRGWVVRTTDIAMALADHGAVLGDPVQVSRGDRTWQISVPPDGCLPGAGAAPSIIDWGERGTPAPLMADLGLTLLEFSVEHPQPALISSLYDRLGVTGAPCVRQGEHLRYSAVIQTPAGPRTLF